MNATKITENDVSHLLISSLPTRPTAPTTYGGLGYTTAQMKAAFDALPLYIIERFNALLDDICAEGEGSVAAQIRTGLRDGHSLLDMFADVTDGSFASYLDVGGESLLSALLSISERLDALEGKTNG